MSWNEPGGNNNNNKNNNEKDPWSKNDAPPDLEELLKKMQMRFANQFGGGRFTPRGPGGQGASAWSAGLIVLFVFVVYLISGIYIVQPAEKAVVTRFGQYLGTQGAGPHWIPRFIDKKQIVNVEAVHTTSQTASMLTKDENIVNVEIAVQYRIEDPKAYLFELARPEFSLKEVIRSALRNVVGHTNLDDVLTKGRALVASQIRDQISQALDSYQSGLALIEVAMQPATPPEAVKSAFDDVIRAREDEQRYINEADTYARKIWPLAEGKARRILEEANAYQQQVVLQAKGETARFTALLPEYQAAPEVMRDRLYLATLSDVFARTPKVIVDGDGSNLMMLPLDQIFNGMKAKPSEAQEYELSTEDIREQAMKRAKEATRGNASRSFDRSVRGE
jgi:membrane protease subunit HflK